jgi:hypothetical protein
MPKLRTWAGESAVYNQKGLVGIVHRGASCLLGHQKSGRSTNEKGRGVFEEHNDGHDDEEECEDDEDDFEEEEDLDCIEGGQPSNATSSSNNGELACKEDVGERKEDDEKCEEDGEECEADAEENKHVDVIGVYSVGADGGAAAEEPFSHTTSSSSAVPASAASGGKSGSSKLSDAYDQLMRAHGFPTPAKNKNEAYNAASPRTYIGHHYPGAAKWEGIFSPVTKAAVAAPASSAGGTGSASFGAWHHSGVKRTRTKVEEATEDEEEGDDDSDGAAAAKPQPPAAKRGRWIADSTGPGSSFEEVRAAPSKKHGMPKEVESVKPERVFPSRRALQHTEFFQLI